MNQGTRLTLHTHQPEIGCWVGLKTLLAILISMTHNVQHAIDDPTMIIMLRPSASVEHRERATPRAISLSSALEDLRLSKLHHAGGLTKANDEETGGRSTNDTKNAASNDSLSSNVAKGKAETGADSSDIPINPTDDADESSASSPPEGTLATSRIDVSAAAEAAATTTIETKPAKSCLVVRSRPGTTEHQREIEALTKSERLYVQWAEQKQRRRKVSFSDVHMRRYPVILGDNPSCELGPPVTVGWDYETMPAMNILDFERLRNHQRRSNIKHLILSYNQRVELMGRIGVTDEERRKVEKEVGKIRRQRTVTGVWSELAGPFEKVADSTSKRVKRVFKRQNARLEDTRADGDNNDESETTSFSGQRKNKTTGRFGFRRQNAF